MIQSRGVLVEAAGRQPTSFRGTINTFPVSDISNPGGWAPEPLWDQINETVASDADFITSAPLEVPKECTVLLGAPQPFTNYSTKAFFFRYAKNLSGGQSVNLTVDLMEGGTVISTITVAVTSTLFTQGTKVLSAAEAASIKDHSNLRFRFEGSGNIVLPERQIKVSWASFRITSAA